MNTSIDQQIEFLGREKFVKFTNTNEFPELSEEIRNFLKNHGLSSDQWHSYPRLMTDGKLKKFKDGLVEIGIFPISKPEPKYCIEASTGKVIFYDMDDNETDIVNTSLEKFLACKYTMAYYYQEIEFKKKYGEYYLNNKKYAQILRNMLNEVEPGIENFPTWQDELFQKELGVI